MRALALALLQLNYLHSDRHQVHRDMKPGNILLNSRGEVKISDFGLSAELDSTKEMCATFIGTHAYMSPERLGGKPYSFASDIWSLGITLVECALGYFPYTAYTGSNYFVLLSQILNDPPPQLPAETFSSEFRDFILQCLCKDPEQRPSAANGWGADGDDDGHGAPRGLQARAYGGDFGAVREALRAAGVLDSDE